MIAGRLTMRARVERDQATGTDAWGNPVAPDFQPVGTLACFAWSTAASKIEDGRKTAWIGDYRALFALGADLIAGDEISAITDRRGVTIIAGRLRLLGPIEPVHTHLEVALERIG
ncbi:MAG: hypothetical protein ACOY45_15745 [Pseudomonadota bacterium]